MGSAERSVLETQGPLRISSIPSVPRNLIYLRPPTPQ